MDAGVLAGDRSGELPLEGAGASVEEAHQGERTVHGRMRRIWPNGQYITSM
jgi:hypothetical protein